MKTQPFSLAGIKPLVQTVLFLPLTLALLAPGQAAEITRTNNTDNLNLATSWTGGVAPTAADIASWTNHSQAGSNGLGAGLSWGGLIIGNPATTVAFSGVGGFTLTLGASGINLSAATVDLSLTNPVALGAAQTWNVAAGRTLTAGGAVSGTGFALTKTGAGTLTLDVGNNYNGGTILNAGTIGLGGNTALGTGTATVNGGTLASVTSPRTLANNFIIGSDFTLGGLGSSLTLNGTVDLGAITRAASIENTTTINGVVSGAGGLTVKSISGRQLSLSAANTYPGSTVVSGGTLRLFGANGSIGSSADMTINQGATLTLDNVGTNNVNRIGNVTVTLNGGTFNLAGFGGTGSNYSETAGSLNLSSSSSTVSSGQAAVSQTSTLTFDSLVRCAGATVSFTGTNLGVDTRNTIVFTTTPALDDGLIGGWATVSNEFASYSSSGTISVAPLGTYDTGAETGWTAASNVKRTTGTTTLTSDRQINSLNLAQTNLLDITAGKTLRVESGGILVSTNRANITNGTLTAGTGANAAGELVLHQNATTTMGIGSVIADNGTGVVALTKSGGGPLSLFGANTFTGGLFFNGGRVNFNHSSAAGTGTIMVGAGAEEFVVSSGSILLQNNLVLQPGARAIIYATSGDSLTLSNGIISGAGGLLRDDSGKGEVTLDGANTFAGGFTITGSSVRLGDKSALGTGTYTIGNPSLAPATPITNSARTNLTGGNAVPNPVVINQNFTIDGARDLEFSNTASLGSAARTITVSNLGDTIFSGVMSGLGGGITKAGTGSLILRGDNTFTGPVTIAAGVLKLSGAGALADTTAVNLAGGAATFDISGISAGSETIGSLAGVNGSFVLLDGKGLTAGADGTTTTFGGTLSGIGGTLTKTGAGTLFLNGTNTHTGVTTVNAGILAGSGILAGPVSVGAGSFISAGTSIGTNTINNTLTILGGAIMEVSKTGSTLAADKITGISTLTEGGSLTVTATGDLLVAGDTFDLFDATNFAGGFTAFNLPPVPLGRGWDTSKLTVDGTIKVVITNTPVINALAYDGVNLTLTGSGGVPSDTFRILSSDTLAIPSASWPPLTTNAFDPGGNFNFPIPVTPAELKRFYLLVYP